MVVFLKTSSKFIKFQTKLVIADHIAIWLVLLLTLIDSAHSFEPYSEDVTLKIGDDFKVSSLPYRRLLYTRRVYRAPAGYNVFARCNINFYAVRVKSIESNFFEWIDTKSLRSQPINSQKCLDDFFYMGTNDNFRMLGAEFYCGQGSVKRSAPIISIGEFKLESLIIMQHPLNVSVYFAATTAGASGVRGWYICRLKVKPIKIDGGIIGAPAPVIGALPDDSKALASAATSNQPQSSYAASELPFGVQLPRPPSAGLAFSVPKLAGNNIPYGPPAPVPMPNSNPPASPYIQRLPQRPQRVPQSANGVKPSYYQPPYASRLPRPSQYTPPYSPTFDADIDKANPQTDNNQFDDRKTASNSAGDDRNDMAVPTDDGQKDPANSQSLPNSSTNSRTDTDEAGDDQAALTQVEAPKKLVVRRT